MYSVGDIVRVKSPFAESFTGEYEIAEIIENEDGTIVHILGDIGGFDSIFLEYV